MGDKIEGTVDAVSSKTKGIKIGDSWYSSTDRTERYVTACQKGDKVEIEIDDKNKVTFIRSLEKTSSPKSDSKSSYSSGQTKDSIPQIGLDEIEIVRRATKIRQITKALLKDCQDDAKTLFGTDEAFKETMNTVTNSLFISRDRLYRDFGLYGSAILRKDKEPEKELEHQADA